jgi:glycosyltransferase involved in cell wall biosynthesis
MINNKKICVVMPAYNAEKTLEKTFNDIPKDLVDDIILADDYSHDNTALISKKLGINTIIHNENKGYGAGQKSCYQEALYRGADIVIMLHPDYQYNPKLIPSIAHLIASGVFDAVIGSRILGNKAIKGGMPIYKYIFNRALTVIENFLIQEKLSEYHTGYRAFSREVLMNIPLLENSDDFVFDNQMLCQTLFFGFKVGEVSCPALYFKDASSINLKRSIIYGIGVLITATQHFISKKNIFMFDIFNQAGKKLNINNDKK